LNAASFMLKAFLQSMGAGVELVSPGSLRNELAKDVDLLAKIYGK